MWGACMVFYQCILLAGYIFAHFMQKWMGVGRYAKLHWLLLLAPFFFCPFDFAGFEEGISGVPLAVAVFGMLFLAVSLPLLALSTTSLVLQRWLAESSLEERRNPYVLYGASNLGSMLALLTYPLIVEPLLGRDMQGYLWWAGYGVMVILHIICMPRNMEGRVFDGEKQDSASHLSKHRLVAWFLLSMAGSAMLLAVTNVITFDVASVPFLWILPLSVYLMCFVLTFKKKAWYPNYAGSLLYWVVIVGMILYLMAQLRLTVPAVLLVLIHLIILFVVCLNCSGRLVRSKPGNESDLTAFYLVMALGGLAGSLVVSWVIPVLSNSLVEYPLAFVFAVAAVAFAESKSLRISRRMLVETALGIVLLCFAVVCIPWKAETLFPEMNKMNMQILLVVMALPVMLTLRYVAGRSVQFAVLLLAVTVASAWTEDVVMGAKGIEKLRNFYGVYKVYDKGNLRYLQHGTTQHGRQYISGPKVGVPLAYFHPTTPAAEVMTRCSSEFSNIGMIGLGTGALTCYAGAGQTFTVYELDPDNLLIAREHFTYLDIAENNGVKLGFKFGDGRILVRKEQNDSLDLLIIDAFNSGSIPVHLLTVEAMEDYFKTLKADGLLLIHVSNKVLNLRPVIYSNSMALGLAVCQKDNAGSVHPDAEDTYWMAVSKNKASIEFLVKKLGWWQDAGDEKSRPRPWTDRYSNILGSIMKEEW